MRNLGCVSAGSFWTYPLVAEFGLSHLQGPLDIRWLSPVDHFVGEWGMCLHFCWVGLVQCPCGVSSYRSSSLTYPLRLEDVRVHARL